MVKIILEDTLEKMGITRYQLSKLTGIRYQIIDNYYKNKVVRYDMYVLDKICSVLKCGISDIIKYSE